MQLGEVAPFLHWGMRTFADLTARDISHPMQDLRYEYEPRGERPERYVAKLLRDNPRLFVRRTSFRWGFAC